MQSCLKICGDCASAKNLPGLQPHRDEEVTRAFGRAARHARRPDVDEAERRPSSAGSPRSRVCAAGSSAASARGAGRASGTGGAASRRRSPRRAGTAAASSARGSRRLSTWTSTSPVGRFGLTASGARATTSPSACRTNSFRSSCATAAAVGRALRVDHELRACRCGRAGRRRQPAVVAARVDPAGDGRPLADVRRVAARRSGGRASSSGRERSDDLGERDGRSVAAALATDRRARRATITTARAPVRPACVIWPLNERPA